MTESEGWQSEHETIRNGAALWERPDWDLRSLTGEGPLEFLHKYCTQEVRIDAGLGTYGCILTVKGGMLGDVWVYSREADVLVVTTSTASAGVYKHLSRFARFDKTKIEDLAGQATLLSVWGPRAAAAVKAACGVEFASGAPDLSHRTQDWRGHSLFVAKNDLVGVGGFDLVVPAGALAELKTALIEAGASPVGPRAVDGVRIEAGIPLFGVDMDEGTIPVEAGLTERAISYDKGCYTGQEVIARIAHRGRVNKHLTGLTLSEDVATPVGLFVGTKQVGRLTSTTRSPLADALIGIGIVHRKHAEPGTALTAGEGGPQVTVRDSLVVSA